VPERSPKDLRLFTLRSDSQFNTTIYRHDDRFRGISGTRMVVLMNPADIARQGLEAGTSISLEAVSPVRRPTGTRIRALGSRDESPGQGCGASGPLYVKARSC